MNDLPGKREDARPIDPQEIKKGLPVWVQLNKKGARVAATIRDHSIDKSRCTVTLEIDGPTNPGQVIRQAYTRPVQVYQLTRREGPAKSTPAPQASPEPEATTSAPEIHTEDQARNSASLTYYSRETLHYQGPHDQARRAYLRTFAKARGYTDFWFTIHGQHSGYYQAGVPKGEEGWTHFLERAVQYPRVAQRDNTKQANNSRNEGISLKRQSEKGERQRRAWREKEEQAERRCGKRQERA